MKEFFSTMEKRVAELYPDAPVDRFVLKKRKGSTKEHYTWVDLVRFPAMLSTHRNWKSLNVVSPVLLDPNKYKITVLMPEFKKLKGSSLLDEQLRLIVAVKQGQVLTCKQLGRLSMLQIWNLKIPCFVCQRSLLQKERMVLYKIRYDKKRTKPVIMGCPDCPGRGGAVTCNSLDKAVVLLRD